MPLPYTEMSLFPKDMKVGDRIITDDEWVRIEVLDQDDTYPYDYVLGVMNATGLHFAVRRKSKMLWTVRRPWEGRRR